jgi:hypothetical protein
MSYIVTCAFERRFPGSLIIVPPLLPVMQRTLMFAVIPRRVMVLLRVNNHSLYGRGCLLNHLLE